MKKILSVVLLVFLLFNQAKTQNENCIDEVNISLITSNETFEFVYIDVVFDKFENIIAIQIPLGYNTESLEFVELQNVRREFESVNVNPVINENKLVFFWSDPGAQPISIADEIRIFTVVFKKLSNQDSQVSLFEDDFNFIEVITESEGELAYKCLQIGEPINIIGEGIILTGKILVDVDQNCQVSEGNVYSPLFEIRLSNDVFSRIIAAKSDGSYSTLIPPGTYDISMNENPYGELCKDDLIIMTSEESEIIRDFIVNGKNNCADLNINISSALLRRCFDSKLKLTIENTGNKASENTQIEILLDKYLTYISSDIANAIIDSSSLTAEIPSIPPFSRVEYNLNVNVSCESKLGQVHCTKAIVNSSNSCQNIFTNWDGPKLELSAECADDSIRFQIINTGSNMLQASEIIIVDDEVMIFQERITLKNNEEYIVKVNADGKTYRMFASQAKDYPGNVKNTIAIEGCGVNENGTFSTGFFTNFAEDNSDPTIHTFCLENIGSYDPNDKSVYPKGQGYNHYVYQNTKLEYLIRFQNTGTDTAFRVRIIDTLSENIDISSIKFLSSSHPYEYSLEGRALTVKFDPIKLVDSTTNLELSNGYIKFSIDQIFDLANDTPIDNFADIYFDFNEPIRTNVSSIIVHDQIFEILAKNESRIPEIEQVEYYPNPVMQDQGIQIKGNDDSYNLEVFNNTGSRVIFRSISNSEVLNLDLVPGVYYFKTRNNANAIQVNKIIIL